MYFVEQIKAEARLLNYLIVAEASYESPISVEFNSLSPGMVRATRRFEILSFGNLSEH